MFISIKRFKKLLIFAALTFYTLLFLVYYKKDSAARNEIKGSSQSSNILFNLETSVQCKEEHNWPTMEFILPLPPLKSSFAIAGKVLMPSLRLFWPWNRSHTVLRIISDGDDEQAIGLANEMTKLLAKDFNLVSETYLSLTSLPGRITMKHGGYDRQQWIEFWVDNFTRPGTEYAAFIDEDTMFTSRVYKSDIFENDKPIVRSLFGKPKSINKWATNRWAQKSFRAVGKKEPFGCMSYFPIIFKIDHIKKMREHIKNNMNCTTFDEAFAILSNDVHSRGYSQFHIMCTYLWWYHRSEYSWQIWQRDPEWVNPGIKGQVATLEEAEITKDYLKRTPSIAFHWTYEGLQKENGAYEKVLKTGLCYSLEREDSRRPSFCEVIVPDSINIPNRYQWQFSNIRFDYYWNYTLNQHQEWILRTEACYDLDWIINDIELFKTFIKSSNWYH